MAQRGNLQQVMHNATTSALHPQVCENTRACVCGHLKKRSKNPSISDNGEVLGWKYHIHSGSSRLIAAFQKLPRHATQ